MRTALAALLFLILSPSGQAQETARIYVYEMLQSGERSWRKISCDGEVVAEIRRGTFFAIDVAPGQHVLGVKGGVSLAVELSAGEEGFVRLGWARQIVASPIPSLYVVLSPAQARKGMINLRHINAKRALSDLTSKSDPRGRARLLTRDAPAAP